MSGQSMWKYALLGIAFTAMLLRVPADVIAGDVELLASTDDLPTSLNEQEMASVIDFMWRWSHHDGQKEEFVRAAAPRQTLVIAVFVYTELCGALQAQSEWSEHVLDQISASLMQVPGLDGNDSTVHAAKQRYVDDLCTAAVEAMVQVGDSDGVSRALRNHLPGGVGMFLPFQSTGTSEDNYSKLRNAMAEDIDDPERCRYIFSLLWNFVNRRGRTARGFNDWPDPGIAYVASKYLASQGDKKATFDCVHLAWQLYSQREKLPGQTVLYRTPGVPAPYDVLQDIVNDAPVIYSREGQLRWLTQYYNEGAGGA